MVTELKKAPPSFGDVVLEVKGLTVRNPDRFEVVRDVSFSIRGGEIFAIAGVSGNGQWSWPTPSRGWPGFPAEASCLREGDHHHSIRRRILAGISYIPEDRQSYGVVLDFSLRDNLALKTYFSEPFSRGGILNPGDSTPTRRG